MATAQEIARQLVGALAPGEPLPLPLPDPLGLVEAEGRAARAPLLVKDPATSLCTRWLQGMLEARDRAIQEYAAAIQRQPLDPAARFRAIRNYADALWRLPG